MQGWGKFAKDEEKRDFGGEKKLIHEWSFQRGWGLGMKAMTSMV